MNTDTKLVGKYELLLLLGSGLTSEVWKAFDPELLRYVAIKRLRPDIQLDEPSVLFYFAEEAQKIAHFCHPNIVRVHDFQVSPLNPTPSDPKRAYVVMDYIEGETLAEYSQRTSHNHKFPSETEIVNLFIAISQAVDYAHQQRIAHCDIEPDNILLDVHNTTRNPMGEPVFIKLGANRDPQTAMTQASPLYISPEQAQGNLANTYSDIYSLGVILYELCTGRPPFRGKGNEIRAQHINQTPIPPIRLNAQISPALQDIILGCLAKDPMKRFPSASALTEALAKSLSVPISVPGGQGKPSSAAPISPSPAIQASQVKTAGYSTPPILKSVIPAGGRKQIALLLPILVLFVLFGAGLWTLLSRPHAATSASVGQVSFLSTGYDANGNPAFNDNIQILLHGVSAPAQGNSFYAWLRSGNHHTPLGPLVVHSGIASLSYSVSKNLLASDQSNSFYTDLLITEQKTSAKPSFEVGIVRYHAPFSQAPLVPGSYSYFQHLQHLLSDDPDLDSLQLPGGIDYWVMKDINELYRDTEDVQDHADLGFVRTQITSIIYRLLGPCAEQQLANPATVPKTVQGTNIASDVQASVSLLDCSQQTKPSAYLTHMDNHLTGLAQAPGATPQQQQLALQQKENIERVRSWLKSVLNDATQLTTIIDLNTSQAKAIRNDMKFQAQLALMGRLNPTTHELEPGIALICDHIQQLASFDVTPS